MEKKGTTSNLNDLEDLVRSEYLDFAQVIFRQILDCHFNYNGPFFEDKVNSLQIISESHHRIQADKLYFEELKNCFKEVENEEDLIKKLWDPNNEEIIKKDKILDYNLLYKALCRALGRNGILYRKERFIRL